MKKLILLLLTILFLTGCGNIQTEIREGILSTLEDEGYIDSKEFSYYFQKKNTTLFVYTMNYTYVYEDRFGDNYAVEIYPKKKEEDFYKVNILEDIEIKTYEEGNSEYKYISNYDIKTELQLKKEKKEFVIE